MNAAYIDDDTSDNNDKNDVDIKQRSHFEQ